MQSKLIYGYQVWQNNTLNSQYFTNSNYVPSFNSETMLCSQTKLKNYYKKWSFALTKLG